MSVESVIPLGLRVPLDSDGILLAFGEVLPSHRMYLKGFNFNGLLLSQIVSHRPNYQVLYTLSKSVLADTRLGEVS